LKSRNGNIVSGAHPEIVAALERLRTADDFIADGEIVARHPRFEGLRTDREAQDVVRERPAG
jgi:ATP-dependent DNA ligase